MGVLSTCFYQLWNWPLRVQTRSKSVHSKHGKFWLTTLPRIMVRESFNNYQIIKETYHLWWFNACFYLDSSLSARCDSHLSIYLLYMFVHDLNFASVENTFCVSLNRFIYYILHKLKSLFAFSRNSDLSQEM